MSTVKSPIVKNVSTALTAAYTNNSGGNATLKAINATGVNDALNFNVTSGDAQEWSIFGTNLTAFNTISTAGAGAPMPIKLGSDRVLLVWLPHHMHVGGTADYAAGGMIHTQVVRYTGTAYQAGPIVNVPLPQAVYTAATDSPWTKPSGTNYTQGHGSMRGISLHSNKVALVYRTGTAFRLMRLNISGNSVDVSSVVNLDLTTATAFNTTNAFDFDLESVHGNTDKVVVGGAGATQWSLQAYNMPDSGAITNASTLFTTGLTATTGHFSVAQLNRTAVSNVGTYVLAATTVAQTTIGIQLATFNNTSNTFSLVGSTVTIAGTAISSLQTGCLSSDATANGYVAFIDTANNNLAVVRQTSLTAASNTVSTTLVMQANVTTRGIKNAYAWGNSKSVIMGDSTLVMIDSSGSATNLVPATLSNTTVASLFQWFPFDTRPLFSFYDPATIDASKVAQLHAYVGAGTITAGVVSPLGNYMPWGHNYGGHYGWNEQAQCWIVGYGGRIYAIDTNGVVLNEISIYQLSPTLTYQWTIKQLAVTPSGRTLICTDQMGCLPTMFIGQQWNAYTAVSYGAAVSPVTTAADLTKAVLLSAPTNFGYPVCIDMVPYVDFSGIERAIGLYVNAATNNFAAAVRFDGAAWVVVGNTAIANAVFAAAQTGGRPNLRLLQDMPADVTNPTGLWRVIGSTGLSTQATIQQLGVSTTAVNEANITTVAVGTVISSGTGVYAATRQTSSAITTVAAYDVTNNQTRAWTSVNGRRMAGVWGWSIVGNPNNAFMNVAVSRTISAVAACNTNIAANTAPTYVFDTITTANPIAKYTLTTTNGNGWSTVLSNSQGAVSVFGAGVNTSYQATGLDTTRLYVAINNGTSDFFITPVTGQTLRTDSSYRSVDTYLIPNGFSVKLRSMLPNAVDTMLTIVEEN